MTIAEALAEYLRNSNESMRSLSLRSGLGAKNVSDIIRLPGLKPRAKTLRALSKSTGLDLLAAQDVPPVYFSDLIQKLDRDGLSREAGRMRWLMRITGWVPETETVCRREVIEFLRGKTGAEFKLAENSFATYVSEAIRIIGQAEGRDRKRNTSDMEGIQAEIYAELKGGDCSIPDWQIGLAGAFLVFLHDRQTNIFEITTQTLAEYYAHRLADSSKTEEQCKRHVIEIAGFLKKASKEEGLKKFGFSSVDHRFGKYSGKFGVDDEAIADLLADFDLHIAPWALGQISRTGVTLDEFIVDLDRKDAEKTHKKTLLLERRKEKAARPGQSPVTETRTNDDRLKAHGFLTEKERWSEKTLACRRGYVVSLAKGIVTSLDIIPDSMRELLDPDFLEAAVDALKDANQGEFSSGYLGSVLKCAKKIARDFQCRPEADLDRINKLLDIHDQKRRGIAPRNMAKLRKFDPARIQSAIDLGDMIVADINTEIQRRRKVHQRTHGVLPPPAEVIDSELGRQVMAAIAHEIMLRNAPRSDNLINARLDWIAWQGDRGCITVPAVQVKMRVAGDKDLTLYLGGRQSKLLRNYLDTIRARCLLKGDERNPYLFPGQTVEAGLGRPYTSLLKRVTRILNGKVGSQLNPHLYRHLLGWIWLKESIDNLPKVQRLLGHKSLQTTLDYYAELDPGLVFDEWNDYLNSKSSTGKARTA